VFRLRRKRRPFNRRPRRRNSPQLMRLVHPLRRRGNLLFLRGAA